MKKKLIIIILIFFIMLCCARCVHADVSPSPSPSPSPVPSPTPVVIDNYDEIITGIQNINIKIDKVENVGLRLLVSVWALMSLQVGYMVIKDAFG